MKRWITKDGQTIQRILGPRYNCFLISFHGKHLLVDTGQARRWNTLIKGLDRLGVDQKSLAALVLTHSHFDHAGNAAGIKSKYKAPIIIHRQEAAFLQRGQNAVIRGTNGIAQILTTLVNNIYIQRFFRFQPADGDVLVEDRYGLNGLGFNGYLLHTPGHTTGSVSVILSDEIAIVGDAMFGMFKGSILPPFAENLEIMINSWKKLLITGCRIYLPAHGSERSSTLLKRKIQLQRIIAPDKR